MQDRLTPLQRRVLQVLASVRPPWTLTGGAALAGVHTGHRATRDLDLFWQAVVLDLVADPAPLAEPPVTVSLEGVEIQVDTKHQILVNKLCAVLSRSELRDLSDVEALLAVGGDLPRALSDAGRHDGGFSPLNLAWVLREFPVEALAKAEGMAAEAAQALETFRASFAERVARAGTP